MSLQYWLPLNGNANNQGLKNDVPTIVGTGITYSSGKIGQSATFPNNCASYIHLPGLNLQEGAFCAWIKILGEGSGNSYQYIISEGRDSNSIGTNIRVTKAGTSLAFVTHGKTININVELNKWFHIAGVFGDGKISLYKDGILSTSTTYTTDTDYSQSNDKLVLGKMSYGYTQTANYFPFNGQLNDVRIYNHALSAKEVEEISKGLILHYKLDGSNETLLPFGYQQLEYIEGAGAAYKNIGYKFNPETDSFKCTFKGNDTSNNGMIFASSSGRYFWLYYYGSSGVRIYADNGSGQQGIAGITNDLNIHTCEYKNKHYYTDGTDRGSLTNTYTECSNSMNIFSYGGASYVFKGRMYYLEIKRNNVVQKILIPAKRISDSVIGMYDIITNDFYSSESSTGFTAGPVVGTPSIIYDSGGYNNNGTIVGSLQAKTSSARYNCCTYIETGASQYINTPVLNLNNEAITLNIWFKSSNTSPPSNYHMVVDSISNRQWYEMCINSSGYFRGGLFVNGSRYADNCSLTTALNGQWHMLTLSYDGNTIRRYYDGIDSKDTTIAKNTGLSSPTAIRIGYDGQSSYACTQTFLSDFRIYSTALTAEQVKELYDTSVSIDSFGNIHTREVVEI